MPSQAREAFLRDHAALQEAVQNSVVASPGDVGALLRRGLTVAGFNLLEGFLEARLAELADHVNSGVVQFPDLPEGLQKKAVRGTLEVAQGRCRRADKSVSELRSLAQVVGESLATVSSGLRLSPFTWMWTGSNLKVADFREILTLFQVDRPWESTAALLDRVGLGPMDVKSALEDISRERHMSAHVSLHNVTPLWLRSLPSRVFSLAFAWDSLASVGANHLRIGSKDFLDDTKFIDKDFVAVRTVESRTGHVAELVEGRKRAVRRHHDVGAAWRLAAESCSAREILVDREAHGPISRWMIPAVG